MSQTKIFITEIEKFKKRGSEQIQSTEDFLEIQLFHPISNYKFIKILKNTLDFSENEDNICYSYEFKENDVLFDVGTFIIPINFFRLSVKLTSLSNKNVTVNF